MIPVREKTIEEMIDKELYELVKFIETNESAMTIYDETSAKHVLSCAMQCRKLRSQVDDTKEKLMRPTLDYHKAINTLINDLKARFEKIEKRLQEKLTDWIEKENQENIFFQTNSLEVEDGKISAKMKWCYEIVDQAKVPIDYREISDETISNDVAMGVRSIPGVRIFEKKQYRMIVRN
jgi:hypothetical protein